MGSIFTWSNPCPSSHGTHCSTSLPMSPTELCVPDRRSTRYPPATIASAEPNSMSERTIFDRILEGEIPCHKVYEDALVFAFLDIAPLAPGHTLVIPKQRATYLHELSEESAAALGRALPKIARAI